MEANSTATFGSGDSCKLGFRFIRGCGVYGKISG